MSQLGRIEQDLDYVRGALERSDARSLYLLWALLVAVGFALPDFAPRHVGTYWLAALPVGWGISAWLARRHVRRTGQHDPRFDLRLVAHWGAMFLALGLVALLAYRGGISWPAVGPLALLIVALTYLLAGVHLDRGLFLPGLLMAAGYALLLFVDGYTWTIVGALVAAGLVVSAFTRSHEGALGSA